MQENRNHLENDSWSRFLSINAAELIPKPPTYPDSKRTLELFRMFKWVLFCFVFIGGLGILVTNLYDEFSRNSTESKVTECDNELQMKDKQLDLRESKLNAELIGRNSIHSDQHLLNKLKYDVQLLKEEVMKMVSNYQIPVCEIKDLDHKIKSFIIDSNDIDKKISKALTTYDADKLALYDYAAEYAGGEIIDTPDTVPCPTDKIMVFDFFKLSYSSSPHEIIKPNNIPGNCFKFYGSKGRVILKLGKKISIGSVTMEHSALVEDIRDAPKEFEVYGLKDAEDDKKQLLGSFVFNVKKERSLQNFPVRPALFSGHQFQLIELKILSNHGHPDFTSIYRFRVHSA